MYVWLSILRTNQEVAVKLEHFSTDPSVLQNEVDVYEELIWTWHTSSLLGRIRLRIQRDGV